MSNEFYHYYRVTPAGKASELFCFNDAARDTYLPTSRSRFTVFIDFFCACLSANIK